MMLHGHICSDHHPSVECFERAHMRFQRVAAEHPQKAGRDSLNCSVPVVVAGPGDVFGELALLYNCPRAASVEAGRPSVLYLSSGFSNACSSNGSLGHRRGRGLAVGPRNLQPHCEGCERQAS